MSSVDNNECSQGETMIAMSLSSRVNVDGPRPGQETATNYIENKFPSDLVSQRR